jgi:hypothetical protein
MWSWEPPDYISLTFRLDKFADRTPTIINMLTVIRRVLDTGTEDAALTQNGDILLQTRTANTLTKHRHSWWTAHSEATHQFPT